MAELNKNYTKNIWQYFMVYNIPSTCYLQYSIIVKVGTITGGGGNILSVLTY